MAASEPVPGWSPERDVFVRMRDGVHLDTDVLLPSGAAEPLPAVLVRTPYDKDTLENQVTAGWTEFFLRAGYAVVVQNERGRFFSEGEYARFLQGADTDGYDTVEWITSQPWSNGRVGTIGCSSSAEQQWPMAASHPAGHAAMIPINSGLVVGDIPGDLTRGAVYRGGVPVLGLWAWWYANIARTERLQLPPDSTQEQRIRLRASYSLLPSAFDLLKPSTATGIEQLSHLPSRDLLRHVGVAFTPFDDYITWTPADERWDGVELLRDGAAPEVPALMVETWHDLAIAEALRLFQYQQARGVRDQYLIVGPGSHGTPNTELELIARGSSLRDYSYGDLHVGDIRYHGSDRGYQELFLNWFGHWLRGEPNGVTEMPRVQVHVIGRGWISGDRWPLEGIEHVDYHLGPDDTGHARTGTGTLSPIPSPVENVVEYVYDPGYPTPSIGIGDVDATAYDQRPVEIRKDVLSFRTAPLELPVTVVGAIEAVLHVSSSAPDTDFMVRLVDVHPDGRAISITDDAVRMRYRAGYQTETRMQPGGVYEVTFTNLVAGIRFEAGHRIGLLISSSSFPLYERNLNTGGRNYDETEWIIARNRVHHGGRYPSRITLPILADGNEDGGAVRDPTGYHDPEHPSPLG